MLKKRIAVSVLALTLVLGIAFASVQQSAARGQFAQAELLDLYSRVSPGVPVQNVEVVFKSRAYRYLELKRSSLGYWVARTPYRFGAHNWVMYIVISNACIKELNIRLQESHRIHPLAAPPDKKQGLAE